MPSVPGPDHTAPPADAPTVAALTYRRPDELARLLPHLLEQAADVDPPARVLVVDNDPAGSAAAIVTPYPRVEYVHEPTPGIAAARNRALDAAAGSSALVFIDDDETPRPGWLAALVATWQREGTAAVGGPVERDLDGLDPWIRATGLFEPYRFPTGTRVRGGATNNLLLDLGVLRSAGLRFDERFGLTGGEDTFLLQSLLRRGEQIAWCAEARVDDPVPVQRLTREWVRARFFRTGNTWVRGQLALAGPDRAARLAVRVRETARTSARLLTAGAVLVAGTVTGRLRWRARGTARACSAAGGLWACLGGVYAEYARVPDTRPDVPVA